MVKKKIKGARQKRKLENAYSTTSTPPPQEVTVITPDNMLEAAISFFNKGDITNAALASKQLIDTNPEDDVAINLMGCIFAQQNRQEDALPYFERAIEINPNADGYELNAGRSNLFLGNNSKAIAHLERSVAINSNNTEPWLWLGNTYNSMLRLNKAEAAFRKVLHLNPQHIPAMESLAATLEQVNKVDEAKELIEQIIASPKAGSMTLLTRAKIKRREQDYDASMKLLHQYINNTENQHEKALGLNELAKIFDKLEDYDQAYDTYIQSQNLAQNANRHLDTSQYFTGLMRSSIKWFNRDNVKSWPKSSQHQGDDSPIFLVGFPRSGTTLTEQILSAHPQIVSTQEASIIDNLILNLGETLDYRAKYPDVLNDLTDAQISLIRQQYNTKLHSVFEGEDISNKIIIDKMPFNLTNIGFINRIYPNARIITLLRDPRDACLSAFMQPFIHNSAMSTLYTLENTIKTYEESMGLYLKFKELLDLNLFELHYEELVEDMESRSRELVEFLGVDWHDEMLNYYSQDKNRHTRTPNEGVMQPIYNRSVNRWKNYKKYIDPHYNKLSPFISTFGYDG